MYALYHLGGMSSDVMKEDNALYGSPGADRVSMGDQVLPDDASNMGASSWDQFSPGRPYSSVSVCSVASSHTTLFVHSITSTHITCGTCIYACTLYLSICL